jgi:hypothetical protein
MIPYSEILGTFAAACLIPSLYRGAVQDLREFKFSEAHFDNLWVDAAVALTVLMYIALICEGSWLLAAGYLALSVIASLVFGFIGFRMGGGGDCRALIFIACIAPFMLLQVLIMIAFCGVAQGLYWLMRIDMNVPPMFRKIPFAVSILCGYLMALVWMIYSNGWV